MSETQAWSVKGVSTDDRAWINDAAKRALMNVGPYIVCACRAYVEAERVDFTKPRQQSTPPLGELLDDLERSEGVSSLGTRLTYGDLSAADHVATALAVLADIPKVSQMGPDYAPMVRLMKRVAREQLRLAIPVKLSPAPSMKALVQLPAPESHDA